MDAWLASLSLPALVAVVAGAFIGLTIFTTASGFALERALRHRRIWDVPLDPGQYRFEAIGNLAYLGVNIVAFVAAIRLGLIPFADGSPLLSFAISFFGFQVYYYFLHRLMHRRAFVRFHRWHHRSRVTTPLTGLSMSVVEAIGWAAGYLVVGAIAARFVDFSAEGFYAYVAFNVYGNILGHANAEVPNPLARTRLGSLFSPPFLYHALHHARWTGHYALGTTVFDRLLGTEWEDWPALHARVIEGAPMESLKARGDRPG